MSRDPYKQSNPYSDWRSGVWGDLMFRGGPTTQSAGLDAWGDPQSRADQIASNWAGIAQYAHNEDLFRKIKGGSNVYGLSDKNMDKYSKNILREAKRQWDVYQKEGVGKDFNNDGVISEDEMVGGHFEDYDDYIDKNPLFKAAKNEQLGYSNELGVYMEDVEGNQVPLAYREGQDTQSGYGTGLGGYYGYDTDKGEYEDEAYVLSQIGAGLSDEQKKQRLEEMGGMEAVRRRSFYDNKALQKLLGYESHRKSTPLWQDTGEADMVGKEGEKEQAKRDMLYWKQGEDWKPEFDFDYQDEDSYTLENIKDPDFWKRKKEKRQKFFGNVKRGAENLAIKAFSDKVDDPTNLLGLAFDPHLPANQTPTSQLGMIPSQFDFILNDSDIKFNDKWLKANWPGKYAKYKAGNLSDEDKYQILKGASLKSYQAGSKDMIEDIKWKKGVSLNEKLTISNSMQELVSQYANDPLPEPSASIVPVLPFNIQGTPLQTILNNPSSTITDPNE